MKVSKLDRKTITCAVALTVAIVVALKSFTPRQFSVERRRENDHQHMRDPAEDYYLDYLNELLPTTSMGFITTTSLKIMDPMSAEVTERRKLSEGHKTRTQKKKQPTKLKSFTSVQHTNPMRTVNISQSQSINRQATGNLSQVTTEAGTCPPSKIIKHFIMNKIEKTGTTTLFSVLTRFIWRNRLNVLMTTAYHIDWSEKSLGNGWLIGPEDTEKADTMICHARYNQSIYDKYFVQDYRYLVPVRHPVSWFKSALKYFGKHLHHRNTNSTEKAIMDDTLLYHPRTGPTGIESYFHLPQLQWLGLDYSKHKDNLTAIKGYIEWITPKIDLPILTDQFDASLIVLRRRFCWNYTDIFYGARNVQHRKPEQLSERALTKLLSPAANLGELLLYEAVNKTWWRQEEVKQEDFWDEVDYFTKLNKRVSEICHRTLENQESVTIIPASRWHERLTFSREFCYYLHMSQHKMRPSLTEYANGTFVPLPF